MRLRWLDVPPLVATFIAALLAGCATTPPESPGNGATGRNGAARAQAKSMPTWPATLGEEDAKSRIARLINPVVKDRSGWATDLYTAFGSLGIASTPDNYCAAIAIIEQESDFQADPAVPGLPDIVRRELDRRADRYGVPKMLIAAALKTNSSNGRTYDQRIDALRTEKQLSDLFDDMASELPFGRQLLADYNPVHTGGPMQVGVSFAMQHAQEKRYPYPVAHALRDELFTRRGGVYFGSAMLLDYPAPYDQVMYRFADYNAGRYTSRNAAFQAALVEYSGRPLALDGDLLRYQNAKPVEAPSLTELALRSVAATLRLTEAEIRRELLLEKSAAFSQSPVYTRLYAAAEKLAGKPLPRQMLPRIDLNSPKFERKLTTEGFARRVAERHRACLARATL
jgi:hypothetical protein